VGNKGEIMNINLKKLAATTALITTLFAGVQMGTARKADAMVIGIATGNLFVAGAGFVFVLAGMGIAMKTKAEGALAASVLGVILEENATPVQVLPKDVSEQVDLGIYTEAEGAQIAAELAKIDSQPEHGVKVAIEGKSATQIRAEIAQGLGISDITAGYLTARAGIQTE